MHHPDVDSEQPIRTRKGRRNCRGIPPIVPMYGDISDWHRSLSLIPTAASRYDLDRRLG